MARTTLPRNTQTKAPVKVLTFAASGATEALSSALAEVSTTITKLETSSYKITPLSDAFAAIAFYFPVSTLNLNDANGVAFSFYVSDPGTNGFITFRFSNDAVSTSTPTNNASHPMYFYGVRSGWNYVRFRWDDTVAAPTEGPFLTSGAWSTAGTGAVSTSTVNYVRMEFYNLNQKPVYLEGMYRGGAGRPKVILTFDAWNNISNTVVAPTLQGYGWKWNIDTPDQYIVGSTLTAINTARSMGASMVLNDLIDRNLVTSNLTKDEIKSMISDNRSRFRDLGWTDVTDNLNLFILNNNAYNDAVIQGFKESGIQYNFAGQNERWITCIENGVDDPLKIGRRSCDQQRFAIFKQWLDRAIQYQCTFVPYWHLFEIGGTPGGSASNNPTPLTNYSEDFYAAMAYLKTQERLGLVDVVDLKTWISQLAPN